MLDGGEVARIFAWMRPNDLIWNYWVNNYLLGKTPPAFDILYWNADSTRLPAALHGDLLDFFKVNPLTHAAGLEVCGTPIDLKQVDLDSFTVAGSNDHITPWDAVYRSALLLGGDRQFVLANSGHIQSIINPPGNPKAYYLENPRLSSDPAPGSMTRSAATAAGGHCGWSGSRRAPARSRRPARNWATPPIHRWALRQAPMS